MRKEPSLATTSPMRWWLVGIILSSFIAHGVAWAGERVDASLLVEDILALPSERMQVKAFLYREGVLGKKIGLGGENIEFFVQNRSIGKAMTGGDGKAYLEFVPKLRGNLRIKAEVRGSPRVVDQEAQGLLAVWEKRRPILLVDIDALLPADKKARSIRSLLPLNLGQEALPAPNTDAVPELEKLGKFYYNLVYLFRSKSVPVEDVRAWLRTHEFPLGMPLVVETGAKALIAFLEHLKADGWENVTAGIGRSVEFAEVLVERRIQTVIIREKEGKAVYPRRTKIVNQWKKVRRHL